MRLVRQPDGAPSETRYAIPVSHSHQFLCVLLRPSSTVVSRAGFAGSVTSQTSWWSLP